MDKDTIDLTDVQKSANTWREIVETFDREQEQREFETTKNLHRLSKSMETLKITFRQNHLYISHREKIIFFYLKFFVLVIWKGN
jgi:hypothetical protein